MVGRARPPSFFLLRSIHSSSSSTSGPSSTRIETTLHLPSQPSGAGVKNGIEQGTSFELHSHLPSSPSPEEVSTVCTILCLRNWKCNLEIAFRESSIVLRPSLVTEVIRLQRDPRRALRFYAWASEQQEYRHDIHAKCAILQFWGHEKLCKTFLGILDCMQKPDFVLSPSSLTVLMKGYGWAGMVDEAMDIFLQYQSSGLQLECQHINCLLAVLIRHKRFEMFESVYGEMERMRLAPNAVTHSLRVLALCKQGKIDDAVDAVTNNILPRPSVILFNIVLDGLCKVGRYENAVNILSEMEKQDCQPDVISYNTVIYGLCKSNRFTDVCALLDEMSSKGFAPTARTYATLIYGLCNAKEFIQAMHVFNLLAETDCHLDTVIYNVLIQGLCEYGFIEDACELLNKMAVEGVVRNTGTYRPFLSYWCKRKELNKALDVLNQMKHCSFPSIKSFMKVIFELCGLGRLEEAVQVLNEMLAIGWEPNENILRALCIGFRKAGMLERLNQFQKDMMQRGYSLPTETRV